MLKSLTLSAFILTIASSLTACKTENSPTEQDVSGIASDNQTVASDSYLRDEADDNDDSTQIASTSSTSSVEDDCEPTLLDEDILKLVNDSRAQARMCGDTHYDAVEPVTLSCKLKKAALSHSRDMGDNNFFSHTGSDGLRVGYRVDAQDYDWLMVGENIARGYTSIEDVMKAWLDSPGHCSTIMGEDFEQTATAVDLPENADYQVYWTMVMAQRW